MCSFGDTGCWLLARAVPPIFYTSSELTRIHESFRNEAEERTYKVIEKRCDFYAKTHDQVKRFSPYIATYFIELARCAHTVEPLFSEAVMFASRILFSIDINLSCPFPLSYGLGHPLAIVVGGIKTCGSNLFINHGVTIGRYRQDMPVIGSNVLLMPNSTVVGRSYLGDNTVVSAGITLINQNVPPNSLVKADSDGSLLFLPLRKDYLSTYLIGDCDISK
jgi:serine O-acetyltransferase